MRFAFTGERMAFLLPYPTLLLFFLMVIVNAINVFPSVGGCGLSGRPKKEDFYVVYY